MTIKHFEELDIKTFIHVVGHLDEFVISEKVDGSELIVGFDNEGKFYTSREEKGGKRFYKESDWPKQFWTTGFRGAHLFLERHAQILREHLNNNEAIEVEVLYGDLPNTVEYNLEGINRIVFLRPINCNIDFEKLIFNIAPTRHISHLWLKDVPTTTTGLDYELQEQLSQSWQFDSITIRPAPLFNGETELAFLNLLDYCHQVKRDNMSMLQLALSRVSSKNKTEITAIRETIQSLKEKIKKSLIKDVLKNYQSQFKSTWIEGLVYRNTKTGMQFKLIDKEKFTRINKEKHEPINQLRNLYWKAFKNDLAIIAGIDWVKKENIHHFDDLSSIGHHDVLISLLEFRTEHNIGGLEYSAKNYKGKNQRIFEEYASLILRSKKILESFKLGTCYEHAFETILFDGEANLKHLKSMASFGTANCLPIQRKDVWDVYFYIWQLLGIEDIELVKLGSLGFAETSGDMDIGIDSTVLNAKQLIEILKKNNIEHTVSPGLSIIHAAIPTKKYSEYVQVDFMLTDKLAWTKFWFTGSTAQSKYKGLYRNALLRAIAGSTNTVKKDAGDTDIYYRQGWVAVPTNGIEYQIKERPIGKKGKRIKTFNKTKVLGHIDDPQRMLANIFLTYQVKPEHVQDFESLWEQVKLYKTPKERKLIIEITIKILKEFKYKIPREFINDI